MKKIALLCVALLAVLTGTALAGFVDLGSSEESELVLYKIKPGDTLSRIGKRYGIHYRVIAEVNEIKNPDKIIAGKVLVIPSSKKNIDLSEKKNVAKKGSRENPVPYTDDEVGDDPWRGTVREGMKLLGIDIPKNAAVRFADEGIEVLPSGALIHMVSGRNKVKRYISHLSPEKAKVHRLGVYVNGIKVASVYQKPECANWLTWERPASEDLPPGTSVVEEKKVFVQPRSVARPFVNFTPWKPERPPQCLDFELSGGTGLLFGSEADMTDWWHYGEGMIWDSCWYWSRGIGFYLNGDMGNTNSPFEWSNFAPGMQAGIRYQDFVKNADGTAHPYGFTAKLRLVWAEMTGNNSDSGFAMTQEDLLLGLYTEYVRRIKKGLIAGVSFEGWLSLVSDIDSNFEGVLSSNRARLELKAFVQKKVSDDWQVRGGAGIFHQLSDDITGAGPFIEFRYHEWFMLGGGVNFLSIGGFVAGPSVRVESGNYFRQKRDQQILDGIWAVDEKGNPKEAD